MKAALFLTDDRIENHELGMIPVMILRIHKESVVEIEKDVIVKKDVNYLSLWLLAKKIDEIYVMGIDPLIKKMFENLGVKIRIFDEIGESHYLRAFFDDIFV